MTSLKQSGTKAKMPVLWKFPRTLPLPSPRPCALQGDMSPPRLPRTRAFLCWSASGLWTSCFSKINQCILFRKTEELSNSQITCPQYLLMFHRLAPMGKPRDLYQSNQSKSVLTTFVANITQQDYWTLVPVVRSQRPAFFFTLKFINMVLKTHFSLTYSDPVKTRSASGPWGKKKFIIQGTASDFFTWKFLGAQKQTNEGKS